MKYKDLPAYLIDQFDNFQLTCVLLIDYGDEKTRELFSKLQRGKPLNPGEKLNAFPGRIVPTMRTIGQHGFFKKVVFPLRRYKAYHITAKLMLLEEQGITDVGPQNIYHFFNVNKDLDEHSKPVIRLKKMLDYLNDVFPEKTPELSNDSWVINLYLLASSLVKKYVMKGKESDLRDFYLKFWEGVENTRETGTGSKSLLRFADANRAGTTSKKNITTRYSIIQRGFLKKHMDIDFLDPDRFFDHYEKTVIYRRDKGICQKCGEKVKWEDYEADHIRAHAKGGKTRIENGQVLCSTCNEKKWAR